MGKPMQGGVLPSACRRAGHGHVGRLIPIEQGSRGIEIVDLQEAQPELIEQAVLRSACRCTGWRAMGPRISLAMACYRFRHGAEWSARCGVLPPYLLLMVNDAQKVIPGRHAAPGNLSWITAVLLPGQYAPIR